MEWSKHKLCCLGFSIEMLILTYFENEEKIHFREKQTKFNETLKQSTKNLEFQN